MEYIKTFFAWCIVWPILLVIFAIGLFFGGLYFIYRAVGKTINWAFTRTRALEDIF